MVNKSVIERYGATNPQSLRLPHGLFLLFIPGSLLMARTRTLNLIFSSNVDVHPSTFIVIWNARTDGNACYSNWLGILATIEFHGSKYSL